MKQLSPEVTDRTRSVNSVLYTLRKKGPGLAAKIRALADPLYQDPVSPPAEVLLPGTLLSGPALSDTLPDFLSQLGFLERAVESAINELARRDLAVFDVERRLTALRTQRDEQVKVVYGKVVKMRYSLLGEFEAPNLELLGLQGPTTQDPTTLVRVAGNLARVLTESDLEFYLGQRASSSTFDVATRAAELQIEVDALKAILNAINNDVQDQQQVQVARQEAMNAYDTTFVRVGRILEDYFLMVGDKEMARRVRPSRSRPGRTEVDPGDLPGDDGRPSDGSGNAGAEGDGTTVERDDGEADDGEADDGEADDGEADGEDGVDDVATPDG